MNNITDSEIKARLLKVVSRYNEFDDEFGSTVFDNIINKDEQWESLLDEREESEIILSKYYATELHHGTAGHNRLMLIAKLTDILDRQEEIIEALLGRL